MGVSGIGRSRLAPHAVALNNVTVPPIGWLIHQVNQSKGHEIFFATSPSSPCDMFEGSFQPRVHCSEYMATLIRWDITTWGGGAATQLYWSQENCTVCQQTAKTGVHGLDMQGAAEKGKKEEQFTGCRKWAAPVFFNL
jgi:hypothetical protein